MIHTHKIHTVADLIPFVSCSYDQSVITNYSCWAFIVTDHKHKKNILWRIIIQVFVVNKTVFSIVFSVIIVISLKFIW